MIFGEEDSPNTVIKLGNDIVPIVTKSKHMGVCINSSKGGEFEFVKDKIGAGKRAYFSVQGIGSKSVPITPIVGSKLYWNLAVPRMTYGLELVNLSANSLASLESAHTAVARQIQGLPKRAVNVCLATLGWSSIEAHIEKSRMLFMWRILNLPSCNIFKKVLIIRLASYFFSHVTHTGPVSYIMDTFHKYDLREQIEDLLLATI